MNDNTNLFTALLAYGADANTPCVLSIAIDRGNDEAIHALAESGADIKNHARLDAIIKAKATTENTLLKTASKKTRTKHADNSVAL